MRHQPTTSAQVGEILAQALASRTALTVCGGESKRPLWRTIGAHAELDMTGLRGIIDYDPGELVITAFAGTPLREIEAALTERRQMLAFEPFDHAELLGGQPGRATLGGIVAANVSGSRRISAGAARDHVLGFSAVSGRAEAFKGGGAVVKNVTGYDLPKLMAGSWGTLAALTSITMRVLPRPRTEKTLLLRGLGAEAANQVMTAAMGLPFSVSAAAHLSMEGGITALRVEGFTPSVEVRCESLPLTLKPPCAVELLGEEESAAFWRRLQTLSMLPVENHALWRVSVPPASGWRVGTALAGVPASLIYDWAGGLIWVATPAGQAQDRILLDAVSALGGYASCLRTVAGAPVESAPNNPLPELHARVKSAFDPQGILNPGLDISRVL